MATDNGTSFSRKEYITPKEKAIEYITEKHLHPMFSSLLGALLLHRPDDPIDFIQDTLQKIKEKGTDKVDWESFVREIHPMRDATRLNLIQNDSEFHKERGASREEAQKESSKVFKLTEQE